MVPILSYTFLYILILSYTPPINVNFAICASGFKTRFFAFFNFTVTNIFPNELFVTITFFMRRHRPPPPVQKLTFLLTFILLVMFILFYHTDHNLNLIIL